MTISRTDFLKRILKYCAESERCTQDAVTKLRTWGVPADEMEDIMKKLYHEKFIDDARFTKSYVMEKWNLEKWGKIKIENGLQQKNLDQHLIENALNAIDEEEYIKALHDLLTKKSKEVKSENSISDARRVMMFALNRGFEEELIQEWFEKEGLDEIKL